MGRFIKWSRPRKSLSRTPLSVISGRLQNDQ
ncbi:hypothetical protein COLO4_02819 [Corchorus olitorius]|uniref:Uncharacterized protein n=1 Tax=Corchorus olitorius TaxID=93759 RepID=A0A1R3L077_9ROSI|nr:hypothetical protein COLO4_02819 [Corchorus olitorius]